MLQRISTGHGTRTRTDGVFASNAGSDFLQYFREKIMKLTLTQDEMSDCCAKLHDANAFSSNQEGNQS